MDPAAPILFFDSGVGGLSVLGPTRALLPSAPIVYVADSAGFPYGRRSEAEIASRVPALLGRLVERFRPRLAVIACNTASTIALDHVRSALDLPVVGTVPAIKPAAEMSKSRVIGVLGTEATVRQPYVDNLAAEFAADCTLIRHGSPELVELAEAKLAGESISVEAVKAAAQPMFDAPDGDRIDTVVLACTHFPLLADELRAAFPGVDLCPWRRRHRAAHRLPHPRSALARRSPARDFPRDRRTAARGPAQFARTLRFAGSPNTVSDFLRVVRNGIAESPPLKGQRARIKLDYDSIFKAAIDRLHEEGRYRVFIDILRTKGSYPNARCFGGNGPKPITVWCSNDYLGMGQNPIGDRGDGEGAARSRRRLRRHPQHQRQHPLSYRARGRACRASRQGGRRCCSPPAMCRTRRRSRRSASCCPAA